MIDLHPDFSRTHTISKAYYSLPIDYLDPIWGVRWSDSTPGLVAGPHEVIFGYEAIASFLEGFASQRSILPFGAIVHLLLRLDSVAPMNPGFAGLNRLWSRGVRSARNAGALFGSLCAGLQASVSAGNVEVLCARLRDTSFPIQWFAGLHNGRAVASEDPELSADSFDDFLLGGLDRLTEDEIAHWLKFGRGSVGGARKTLIQEPPAAPPWDAVVTELLKRPRLSTASAYADQMVTALSVPPRRHAPQQLPLGGYADVVTRGQVERLLPSQHAFDDLEFLRRYAEGELLYFRREEPPSRNRMEMAIALDQGVRTWGDVRLVLAAAVLALVGRADRKKLRLTIAATSRPGFVEPLGMAAEDLGKLLEASDLSRDPGMALERVLDDPAAAPRDIYLLTHPFALAEDDVRSAALRLRPGNRLFALALNAKGAAELSEIRRDLPVRLRAFHVDFAAATAPPPASKPQPTLTPEPAWWSGSIEQGLWPFPCPVEGAVAHFDFDHAGKRLFIAYANTMIATWDLATKRMELLPRPKLDGKILGQWQHTLGVRDGFALLGQAEQKLVIVHYDMTKRKCQLIPIGEATPGCRLVPLRGNHAVVVASALAMFGVVHLGRGLWHPSNAPERPFWGSRTLRPFEPAPKPKHVGTYRVDGKTGTITLVGADSHADPMLPFTPTTDGKPTYAGTSSIQFVHLAGSTAAIGSHPPTNHPDSVTVGFFRGPSGDFIRQTRSLHSVSGSPRIRLSQDGRLVAICENHRVEVQTVDDPRRLLLTPSDTGKQAPARIWLGDSSFVVSCGRLGYSWHLVDWSGALAVYSESRRTKTLSTGFRNQAFERFIALAPKPTTDAHTQRSFDPAGCMFSGMLGLWAPSLDRRAEVTMVSGHGYAVLHFYAHGDSWSSCLPDGTRFGRGHVHLWRNTPGAAAKMGDALRRAMKGGTA